MGLMFPIYFLSLIMSAGLTLLSTYQILEMSDLDCDQIESHRCCANLNKVVIPELVMLGALVAIHAVTLNWISVATILPMFVYLTYLYRSTSRGYVALFDPSSICDQKIMNKHVRRCVLKIGFHIVHFIAYMYLAMISLITV